MELPPLEEHTDSGSDINVTVEMVLEEVGRNLVDDKSSPLFPEEYKREIIGRWIEEEKASIVHFTGWAERQVHPAHEAILLRKALLYRVCARVVRHYILTKRVGVQGLTPSYSYVIYAWLAEADMIIDAVISSSESFVVTFNDIQSMYLDGGTDEE